jgi:hypothetical protein
MDNVYVVTAGNYPHDHFPIAVFEFRDEAEDFKNAKREESKRGMDLIDMKLRFMSIINDNKPPDQMPDKPKVHQYKNVGAFDKALVQYNIDYNEMLVRKKEWPSKREVLASDLSKEKYSYEQIIGFEMPNYCLFHVVEAPWSPERSEAT